MQTIKADHKVEIVYLNNDSSQDNYSADKSMLAFLQTERILKERGIRLGEMHKTSFFKLKN